MLQCTLHRSCDPQSVPLVTWRATPAVHQWLVAHVPADRDDGGRYPVSAATLRQLCATIVAVWADPMTAPDQLPASAYDTAYWRALRTTYQALNQALTLAPPTLWYQGRSPSSAHRSECGSRHPAAGGVLLCMTPE